ncbi:hypothetical protein F5051DRAFT_412954 [Lentinula edodes]|nr:hypothetical protein F5051DRAFT_412954 [Lentinula edodes]
MPPFVRVMFPGAWVIIFLPADSRLVNVYIDSIPTSSNRVRYAHSDVSNGTACACEHLFGYLQTRVKHRMRAGVPVVAYH